MIEGLQVRFSSAELVEHLAARAEFHRDKVAWYSQRIEDLQAGGPVEELVTNDPVSGLKRSRDEHQRKAAHLFILATHIVPDEVYQLQERDLIQIEMYEKYW